MAPSILGARLRSYRERRGWSQKTLAASAGISYRVVQSLEQGRTQSILMHNAIALARALDISTDALYGITQQGRRSS